MRYGWADLPGVTWRAACLCGVGFMMSIFIANAAFDDPETLTLAKLSAMLASVAAAFLGWILLRGPMPEVAAETQPARGLSSLERASR